MRVAVVHNKIMEPPTPDEEDVLVQRDAVMDALRKLGHEACCLSCDLNLKDLKESLKGIGPDLVFNLVEALEGQGRLIHLPAAVYESLDIPYTGAPLDALFLTSHKVMTKEMMRQQGLPTPDWVYRDRKPGEKQQQEEAHGQFIIKSLWEDASVGLDDASIVRAPRAELLRLLTRKAGEIGAPWFAEQYIEGREFNMALLAGPEGPQVLPPAEIVFIDYPEDKPRIVGYKAKWDEGSFEHSHTPRKQDFPGEDGPLLDTLARMSEECWQLFGLQGYGRVDFRVDVEGRPWILEVNANPCLDPEDAGFAAAVRKAGMTYESAIGRIVDSAMR
ncbi:MAG: D-alanine--D-alanine ligase [Planctomycetota bacterium]